MYSHLLSIRKLPKIAFPDPILAYSLGVTRPNYLT